MDYTALHDELTNDPAGVGYAPLIERGSDADVLALLTRKSFPGDVYISIDDLSNVLAGTLAIPALKRGATNANLPQQVQDYCATMIWLLETGNLKQYRLNNPQTVAGMGAVVATGVLPQATIDAINAEGRPVLQSRADIVLAGVAVTLGDISFALRGDR